MWVICLSTKVILRTITELVDRNKINSGSAFVLRLHTVQSYERSSNILQGSIELNEQNRSKLFSLQLQIQFWLFHHWVSIWNWDFFRIHKIESIHWSTFLRWSLLDVILHRANKESSQKLHKRLKSVNSLCGLFWI